MIPENNHAINYSNCFRTVLSSVVDVGRSTSLDLLVCCTCVCNSGASMQYLLKTLLTSRNHRSYINVIALIQLVTCW